MGTLNDILVSLYQDPATYDRDDLFVTMLHEGEDVRKADLPARLDSRDDVMRLAQLTGRSVALRGSRLIIVDRVAELIIQIAALERLQPTHVAPHLIGWLTDWAEHDDEFLSDWAGNLLDFALDMPQDDPSGFDQEDAELLDEIMQNVAFVFSDEDDEEDNWWRLARQYYRRIGDLAANPNLQREWVREWESAQEAYARAIVACRYLEVSGASPGESSLGELEGFQTGTIAHWSRHDNERMWSVFEHLSGYAGYSNYADERSIIREVNNEVAVETISGFTEQAGPLEGWLEEQWTEEWAGKVHYEDPLLDPDAETPYAIMYYPLADLDVQLEQYPILDDTLEAEKRMEAEVEAAADQIPWRLLGDHPEGEGWAGDLLVELQEVAADPYEWDPEIDDTGYIENWPEDPVVARALLNLGWLTHDTDEWAHLLDVRTFDIHDWLRFIAPAERAAFDRASEARDPQQLLFDASATDFADEVSSFMAHIFRAAYDDEALGEYRVAHFAETLERLGETALANDIRIALDAEEPEVALLEIFIHDEAEV